MDPDPYPLKSIYETEHQAMPRSEVPQTVDDRMTDYLTEGYLKKVYDRPKVAMVDSEADQLVKLTDEGEQALEEVVDQEL